MHVLEDHHERGLGLADHPRRCVIGAQHGSARVDGLDVVLATEQRGHLARGVVADQRAEHRQPGPVRRRDLRLVTAAHAHPQSALPGPERQLAHQRALADAGLTGQEQDSATPVGGQVVQRPVDHGELCRPADDRPGPGHRPGTQWGSGRGRCRRRGGEVRRLREKVLLEAAHRRPTDRLRARRPGRCAGSAGSPAPRPAGRSGRARAPGGTTAAPGTGSRRPAGRASPGPRPRDRAGAARRPGSRAAADGPRADGSPRRRGKGCPRDRRTADHATQPVPRQRPGAPPRATSYRRGWPPR